MNIFVCAFSYEAARRIMRGLGYPIRAWRYIDCSDQLRGVHGGNIYFFAGYYNLKSAEAVKQTAKYNGMLITHGEPPKYDSTYHDAGR